MGQPVTDVATMPAKRPPIGVYLNDSELRAFEATARRFGLSRSAAARMLILNWVRENGMDSLLTPSSAPTATEALPKPSSAPTPVATPAAAAPAPVASPPSAGEQLTTTELAKRYGIGRNTPPQAADRAMERIGRPIWKSRTGDRWLRLEIEGVGGQATYVWRLLGINE